MFEAASLATRTVTSEDPYMAISLSRVLVGLEVELKLFLFHLIVRGRRCAAPWCCAQDVWLLSVSVVYTLWLLIFELDPVHTQPSHSLHEQIM